VWAWIKLSIIMDAVIRTLRRVQGDLVAIVCCLSFSGVLWYGIVVQRAEAARLKEFPPIPDRPLDVKPASLLAGADLLLPGSGPDSVVVFGDYQCQGSCRALELISRLDRSEVSFYYRHFPLDQHALGHRAAVAAEQASAAGQFRQVHQRLISRALTLASTEEARGNTSASPGALEKIAKAALESDLALAGKLGLWRTPTFVYCPAAGAPFDAGDPKLLAALLEGKGR
jgi:protein-disulfide isomerase